MYVFNSFVLNLSLKLAGSFVLHSVKLTHTIHDQSTIYLYSFKHSHLYFINKCLKICIQSELSCTQSFTTYDHSYSISHMYVFIPY